MFAPPFQTHPFSAKPLAANKQLYFTVAFSESEGRERIVVVDGGGTSATIRQADIGATNGVIHIVNHVLGIGDNTIYDRLKTDPTLKYVTDTKTKSSIGVNL